MNNFTKYICAGLVIVLLVIQTIIIMGLYGNFSDPLNELSDCTRDQLPQLINLSSQHYFSPCSAWTESRATINS